MSKALLVLGLAASALTLSACNKNILLVKRSQCPAVAVAAHTGSLTQFSPAQSRNADAIDITAQLVDVKGTCLDGDAYLTTDVGFTVAAQRRNAAGAREVQVPVFVAMAQGGNVLQSKQLVTVTLKFADGQLRTQTVAGARTDVHRSAVTLPEDVQARITRERRPDEPDALVDPLADPQVRAAVRAASYEVLVGFQLDQAALAYNLGK